MKYNFTKEQVADAWKEAGNYKAAGRILGTNETTYRRWLEKHFPDGLPQELMRPPPEGHKVGRVSTLYGPNGEVRSQWIISQADVSRQREILEAAAAELAKTLPRQKPTPPPRRTSQRLLNLYTLTDCHVGALAWEKEAGEDWDLAIAERTITECFRLMIEGSPPADKCIVNELGDFLHFDSLASITPTSGHLLDSDSRYAKVVQVAVRILRTVIDLALAKHRHVHVITAEGNHNPAGSIWMRTLLAALYEKEKRVTVETSPRVYLAYQHGKTMLAFHHGHQAKFDRVTSVFAAEYPEMWGATTKRYAHTGHYHHSRIKEDSGMVVEQHPTLAARDAYAARLGLHAMRRVESITYHDIWGQVGRTTIYPEMIDGR